MAVLKLHKQRLQTNYNFLDKLFKEYKVDWAIVTKMLCGNELFLKEVLSLGIKEVCDSRLSNLQVIKKINPDVRTVYIKPPPLRAIDALVQYADVSFISESSTIEKASEEAVRQGKVHRITIMIELGDLREGVMGEDLIDFYDKVFRLPNIEIVAIGANLNCLHGVMPSPDKLVMLSLYKQLIEATFKKKIRWVSGGTSVTLPLLLQKQVPASVNHFRIGETLYFGVNLVKNETIPGMEANVFTLEAEILELSKKPIVPTGELAENPSGEVFEIDESEYGQTAVRALIDVGLLDIAATNLFPIDTRLSVVNASSDMLVVDLGKAHKSYKVGDSIAFHVNYMGALRLLSSDYIMKEVV